MKYRPIEPNSKVPHESTSRLRSVPFRRPFVWAEILAFLNYCGAVAVITVLPLFLLDPKPIALKFLLISVAFYGITGIASFLKRRHVLCPLCKGTPLVSSRAHVHANATRIFPLDYGTSAMIVLLATQTFRCMYCGARYDLLKRRAAPDTNQESLN